MSYFVSLNDDTPSNTQFGKSARIIFDENDPIDTPAWFNTLDTEHQQAAWNHWMSLQTETDFTVSGVDQMMPAVLEHIRFMYHEDGGEFTVWQDSTSETSATFTGENGKIYAFISRCI